MDCCDVCIFRCIRYINDKIANLTIEITLPELVSIEPSVVETVTWLIYHSAESPPSMYLSEERTPRPTKVDFALIVGRFKG